MSKKKVDHTVIKTVVKHHHTQTRPRNAHIKRHHPQVSHNHISKETLEEQTIHSLVELQKVHVNLSEKFEKLTTQIENLLALFELAARNFVKQPNMQNTEKDKEFLDKIDKLLDQNKLLAKGLSLMEEKMRERVYGVNQTNQGIRPPFRPQNQQMQPSQTSELEEI
ncbi:MAG: hypothetical protein AABX23_02145 [Nanoarchaeota archaeon]